MDNIDVSVIKYLGKVQDGIIALITITIPKRELAFDATFFYTQSQMIITIPEVIEEKIGDIKTLTEYETILRLCLRKVVPYDQLYDNIDPLDVKPYLKEIFPDIEF